MLIYNIFFKCFLLVLIVFLVEVHSDNYEETDNEINNLHRQRRAVLLYPRSTVLQLNIGVGTPTPVKTIQINWAIQANFQLPWDRTQIPIDVLGANSGYYGDSRRLRREEQELGETEEDYKPLRVEETSLRVEQNNEYELFNLYKSVEEILTSYGYNGSLCVRHTLCELGADPIYPHDEEDLLHEIASVFLNPNHENVTEEKALQYIEAYDHGLNSEDCTKTYDGCPISLLNMFSNLY